MITCMPNNGVCEDPSCLHCKIAQLEAERDQARHETIELQIEMERHGLRECDIAACNCGRWHNVKLHEILDREAEIRKALLDAKEGR